MLNKTYSFNPSTDIGPLTGKTIVITGANTGLGKQTAIELSKHNPSHIWMTARDPQKGQAAVAEVNAQTGSSCAHFLELDLSSFSSIRSAAATLRASISRLDMLFLNAGIFGHPPALTDDGYEIHFGINHLGHALLLKLLLPLLLTSASGLPSSAIRVIILTSIGYKNSSVGTIQFPLLKQADGASPAERYIQSKIANLLYAKALARRYSEFVTVPVHPGEVGTDLFSRDPGDEQIRYLQTEVVPKHICAVEEGVKNQLWAATAEGPMSGEYYEPVGIDGKGTGVAEDEELQEMLWEWTEAELNRLNV